MKDIFARRALQSFVEVLHEFVDSLQGSFSSCEGTQSWHASLENPSPERHRELVEEWIQAMDTPLRRGCAKYAKAVTSILEQPASVYHAVAYRDVHALHKSSAYFAPLDFPSKVEGGTMSTNDVAIFWQYLDELNQQAFLVVRRPSPRVPTTSEISADITRRKGENTKASEPVLKNGLKDVWAQLCRERGVPEVRTHDMCVEDVGRKLFESSSVKLGERSLIELCRTRDGRVHALLFELFPYLDVGKEFTESQWGLLDRALSLSTMEGSIPTPMMRGIEEVASELVADISSGRTSLGTLNVEAIGQRVLSNVTPEEMSHFANNLDKIIPAMQNM